MDIYRLSLDKDSAVPLYEQLRTRLMEAIRRRELSPGEQLPTEEALCAALGISRPVVQAACKALIHDGYIRRIRGKGTFVCIPDTRGRFISTQLSFAREMAILGLPHHTEVLSAAWTEAPALPDGCGGPWYHLRRLRFVNDRPFVLVENDVPGELFPGIDRFDFGARSLYEVFEKEYGVHVARSRRTMTAALADAETAAQLQLCRNAPVMVVDNIVRDPSGRIIDLSREWLDGKAHPYSFDVYNP